MSHRTLLVLPDDGVQPLLFALANANRSLHVKMFLFNEPSLVQAVAAARKRGVKVQVMLNPNRTNGEAPNEVTRLALLAAGVEVKDSHPAFKVTHEKSLVIDENLAFIQSLNWSGRHLSETRDFAVATTHKKEVAEILECFRCDWERSEFQPGATAHLLWCPANGRTRIAHFIDRAQRKLLIQNDRYQDMVIIERLMKAAERGVQVHLLSPQPHTLKQDKLVEGIGGLRVLHSAGIKVHHLHHLSLHAKMLLADDEQAIIGSINLSTGSFDERRELAIELDDPHVIHRLRHIAHHDWQQSQPIDLSDKGLYEDLENRGSGGGERLVLRK